MVEPRSTLSSVTTAPGITALFGSTTVPYKVEVTTWPLALETNRARTARINKPRIASPFTRRTPRSATGILRRFSYRYYTAGATCESEADFQREAELPLAALDVVG